MTNMPAAAMTTDTVAADHVVVPTPDFQSLIHRLNLSVYGDGNDELVEPLTTSVKGKISIAKVKMTISTLTSILNDCVDEITRQQEEKCHEKSLLDVGDLLLIWLREYRDSIIEHSDWENLTNY